MGTTKQTILEMDYDDCKEQTQLNALRYFYDGQCKDLAQAVIYPEKLGQSWLNPQDMDYVPTQDIRNKVKSLLKKQARFMFGKAPTLKLQPIYAEDKAKVEELRIFLDNVLKENKFWSMTQKAFLLSTVQKRVLLRAEVNPGKPIKIYYHSPDSFTYEMSEFGMNETAHFMLAKQRSETVGLSADKHIWDRFEYFMQTDEETQLTQCMLRIRTYKDMSQLDKFEEVIVPTGLTRLPGWVILNEGYLGEDTGESDVDLLVSAQKQYNSKVSDFADALRFQMFGTTVITDATEDSVNAATIAPNALLPLISLNDKTAAATRLESSFSNADPIKQFLDRAEKDMYEALGIPMPSEVKTAPSAKAIKYLYTELLARCEEKWNDWEDTLIELIDFIKWSAQSFNGYTEWKKEWNNLLYTVELEHNYPLPDDEEDKKRLAIEEVNANVKSRQSYIKDYTSAEDPQAEWDAIIEEQGELTSSTTDQFGTAVSTEIDALGNPIPTIDDNSNITQ